MRVLISPEMKYLASRGRSKSERLAFFLQSISIITREGRIPESAQKKSVK